MPFLENVVLDKLVIILILDSRNVHGDDEIIFHSLMPPVCAQLTEKYWRHRKGMTDAGFCFLLGLKFLEESEFCHFSDC